MGGTTGHDRSFEQASKHASRCKARPNRTRLLPPMLSKRLCAKMPRDSLGSDIVVPFSLALTPPTPSPPALDQVTMTDLPEALPILRHNTEATFGGLAGGGVKHDVSKSVEACRRPTIRQLRWGDEVEAGEVAASAAAAAAVEGAGESSEWQGFDLVVVRG